MIYLATDNKETCFFYLRIHAHINYLVFLCPSFGVKKVLTHLLSENCNRIVDLCGDRIVLKHSES